MSLPAAAACVAPDVSSVGSDDRGHWKGDAGTGAPWSAGARARKQGRTRAGRFCFRLIFDERFQPAQRVVPMRGNEIEVFLHVAERSRIEFEEAFTPRMRVAHDSRRFEDSQVFGDRLPSETSAFRKLRYGISLSVRQP